MSPLERETNNLKIIKAADGTELFIKTWKVPEGIPRRGAVLVVHGVGEHCFRYNHVAVFLNSMGLEVRGYDHRGFGRSGGKRAVLPANNTFVEDLKLVFDSYTVETASQGDNYLPFLMGHSMGGCIAAKACTDGLIKPRGIILSSPGLLPNISGFKKQLVKLLLKLVPDKQVPSGLPISKISRDKTVVKAYKNDPFCHDLVTPRVVEFMLTGGKQAIEDARKLTMPTLLLVSGSDNFVKPEGSIAFHKNLPEGLGKIHIYDNLYHEILNEIIADRQCVFNDLKTWIEIQLEN